MKKNLLLTLFTLFIVSTASQAQYQLGIANSNFAGTNGMYLNPASIANSPHRLYVNIFNIDINASNNYYKIKGGVGSFIDGEIANSDLILQSGGNHAGVQADIRLPSVAYQINENNSFAIGIRARTIINANNVSENIYSLVQYDGDFTDIIGETFQDEQFNLNVNGFVEYSGTYARTILKQGKHFLKGGITFKYLAGFSSVHVSATDFDYSIQQDVTATGTEDFFQIATINGNISYSSNDYDDIQASDVFGGSVGRGLGWDIGFSYTFNPDEEGEILGEKARVQPYLFKVGLAITDMGSIRYSGGNSRSYEFVNQGIRVNEGDVDFSDPEVLVDAVQIDLNDFESSYRAKLPATLNLTFDYHIAPKIYANLTWIQNLRSQEVLGMRNPSLISVAPRFETKLFEASLPLTFAENYKNFQVGLALRLGYLIVGTDHLNGLVGLGDIKGANAYFGLHLPFFKRD